MTVTTPDSRNPDSEPDGDPAATPAPGSAPVADPAPYEAAPYPAAPYPAATGGPTFPPPVDYQARTNPTSIVAIVLGFLVPIGGIVAGIIALSQIRRTQEKGRGLAITGISVGSFLTLFYIALGIALVVFSSIAAQTVATDPLLGGDSSTEAPLESEAPIEEPPADEAELFTFTVGECLNADGLTVDCGTPHDYEVYAQQPMTDAAYPGEEAALQTAETVCGEAFVTFAGIAFEESTLGYNYAAPTAETWDQGDRSISCLITDPAGQVTGTLAGAAR